VGVSRTSSPELLVELERGRPLAAQLEQGLRDGVRSGRLAPGTVLPSTRTLAHELGVSRGVVVAAYAQLGAEGYLVVRQGAPVRVARAGASPMEEREPPLQAAPRYNLRPDVADYASFPRREWLVSLRAAVHKASDEQLGYGDARGAEQLRVTLAAYVGRSRGVDARPARLHVTVGFAAGLSAVCAALRARGARRIAIEDPGHLTVRRLVEHTGLELVPVPVDEHGLRVEELPDVDIVLVTPAHHFPTTAVLSPARRTELLARDVVVLEDDVDAEFRYDRSPVGALQGLAPERVVYLGSASRTLAPALRLGWSVLPSWLAEDVRTEVERTIIAPPVLDQLALAHFVERGELDRHLRRMRLHYRRRRDVLVRALDAQLPQLHVEGVAAGLHVVARLPDAVDERAVLEAARARRIALGGLGEHAIRPAGGGALLLGFARSPEPTLRAGIRELSRAIDEVSDIFA
jgi:GntR family transcriptional regulator / MocR family aminotransferase